MMCVVQPIRSQTTDIFSIDTFGLLIDINIYSRNGEPFRLAGGFYVCGLMDDIIMITNLVHKVD